MKNRKKNTIIKKELRNELFHRTILHSVSLSHKNTELSNKINILEQNIVLATMSRKQKFVLFCKKVKNVIKKMFYMYKQITNGHTSIIF